MYWTQFLILLGSLSGLFFWNRNETRNEISRIELMIVSNNDLIKEIHNEIKDFHGRLCTIEERYRGLK